jgi:hypothetical protein
MSESGLSEDLPSSKLLALAKYTHHSKTRKTRYHITSHITEKTSRLYKISLNFAIRPPLSSLRSQRTHTSPHHPPQREKKVQNQPCKNATSHLPFHSPTDLIKPYLQCIPCKQEERCPPRFVIVSQRKERKRGKYACKCRESNKRDV